MCEGRGLDPLLAPSTILTPVRSDPATVALQLELETRPVGQTWLQGRHQPEPEIEAVTANVIINNLSRKIVTSLPSSNKRGEVEWNSEPLQEDGNVGLRISRRPLDIPQVDGADIEAFEEGTKKETIEEKETQTDVFIKVDKEGDVVEPFIDLLYDIPPTTVYHPMWGFGKYNSTEDFKDTTNSNRKAHCYRFENVDLCDV